MKRSCGKFMKYAELVHGPLLRRGTGGSSLGDESELSGRIFLLL